MRDELYPEMFDMEQRHWWFRAKHTIVGNLLHRYLPPTADRRPRIADLGCGCGMMLYKLRDSYDVVGLDGSPQAIAFCAQRGVKAELGKLPDELPFERESFDAVMLLDVLEHLERDSESAVAAASLLRPGGILLCTVPAYQWLWSRRDEHHQHFRRYSRSQFARLFDQPSLHLELLSFYNTWLFPLAAGARLASRFLPANDAKDLHVPPAPINRTMDAIFASERALLGRLPLPFGLSLLAIARKN